MFNLSDEALKEIGAFNTVRETQSQPKLWIETFALYRENKEKIEAFIKSVKEKDDRVLRVVFTGAGSSEY